MLCDYTLVTNGCSFSKTIFPTLTQEQSIPYNWPHKLADLLSINKVENLALGGGSNQQIHRTTLNRLINNQDKILLVIQLTELSRFEWYKGPQDPHNPLLEIQNNNWIRGWLTADFIDPSYKGDRFTHLKTKASIYSDLEAMYTLYGYLGNIKMMCDRQNIPYIFWFPHCWYAFFDIKFRQFVVKYLKYYMYDYFDYEKISSNDGHPSQDGHQTIAQKLYERIAAYGLLK